MLLFNRFSARFLLFFKKKNPSTREKTSFEQIERDHIETFEFFKATSLP